MDFNRLVQEIDSEISRLQQARDLLTGQSGKRGPGRPKAAAPKRKPASSASSASKGAGRKRRLSPEGRKRIADAMRKRWAERKKQQSGK